MTEKIIRNSAKCRLCGDEIESKTVHDFVSCSCGAVSIDGGKDYQRWVGELSDIIDTSIIELDAKS